MPVKIFFSCQMEITCADLAIRNMETWKPKSHDHCLDKNL